MFILIPAGLIIFYIVFIVIVVAMQLYETKEEKQKGRIPHLQDSELLKTYVAYRADHTRSDERPREALTLRPRAYSLRAKLDVAIATEVAMQRRMKGTATEVTTAGPSNDEVDDTLPPSRRPTGLFWEFLYDINPINAQDWKNGSICVKTILVLRAPVTFLLQCLIPVVNETAEKRGWSKLLNCLQLVITPVAALVKLRDKQNSRNLGHRQAPLLLDVFLSATITVILLYILTSKNL